MAGYENEAAWEQYVRKDVALKEEMLARNSVVLDITDIITGDLSKFAGALQQGAAGERLGYRGGQHGGWGHYWWGR